MSKRKNYKHFSDPLFIGCLFIGLGIGMYFHQIAIGVILGMGVGVIVAATVAMYRKK